MKKPGLITAIICIGLLANMSQVLGQDKLKESSSKHGLGAGFATYRNFSNINLTGETALYYKF
jgi:hypothetical protein